MTAARRSSTDWGGLLDGYRRHHTGSAVTLEMYLERAQDFIDWAVGSAPNDVDAALISEYLDHRFGGLAPQSRRAARTALRDLFAYACRAGDIPINPAVSRPTKPAAATAPGEWRSLLVSFEEHAEGADVTVNSHVARVRSFARWVGVAPGDVSARQVADYLDRPGMSKSTRNGALVSLRAVFSFALAADLLPADPTTLVPVPATVPLSLRPSSTPIGSAHPAADSRVRLQQSAQLTHPARLWARATGRPVGRDGALSVHLLAEWSAAGSPVVVIGDDIEAAWGELLADLEITLRARGIGCGTVRLYKIHTVAFARWAQVAPAEVDEDILVQYLARDSWKPNTRRSVRTALTSVFRHAHRRGWIDENPAAELPTVRVPRGVPKPAPDRVIGAAVSSSGAKIRLMVLLGAGDGLRRAEIAVASIEDFTDEGLRVHGKGGKVRLVPIHADVRAALDDYLTATGITTGYLFPGRADGHLSPDYVGRLVTRALAGPWTTHTLRHRFNSRAYAATGDLRAVQELAGHASPTVTAGYVAVLGKDLVRAVDSVPSLLPRQT